MLKELAAAVFEDIGDEFESILFTVVGIRDFSDLMVRVLTKVGEHNHLLGEFRTTCEGSDP